MAMIFELLGVRPVRDEVGNVVDVEPVPAEELGSVQGGLVTMCGIFRDTFPNVVELIDRAVRKVAELDEPEDVSEACQGAARGGHERPEARVFGLRPDLYAADNMRSKIESSDWDDESELIDAYLNDTGYVYGEAHGEETLELFEWRAGGTRQRR